MKPRLIQTNEAVWYGPGRDGSRGVLIAPVGLPLVPLGDLIRAGKSTYLALRFPPRLRDDLKVLEELDASVAAILASGRYAFVMFEDAADVEWLQGLRWVDSRGEDTNTAT